MPTFAFGLELGGGVQGKLLAAVVRTLLHDVSISAFHLITFQSTPFSAGITPRLLP